jgi:uncharacterized membrane protein YeaQ/YmgE (transglycosylase-associated protein family)
MTHQVTDGALLLYGAAMGIIGAVIGAVVVLALVARHLPPPRSRSGRHLRR